MIWFWAALLGAAIFATCNHIDKYVLTKYCAHHSPITLLIYSSLIGIFVAPIIGVIYFRLLWNIDTIHIFLLIGSGVAYLLGLLPYLFALDDDDASLVIPTFQTIPIFSFILGYLFLHEQLSLSQVLGGAIVLLGAVGLNIDMSPQSRRFKWKIFILMLIASFLFASNYFLFKLGLGETNYWAGMFWVYIGFIIPALVLLSIRRYRKSFTVMLYNDGVKVISLNFINEMLNTLGVFVINYSLLLAPIALANIISNGVQPVFVLIFGFILTLFFPKISQENFSKPILLQKLIFIGIVVLGVIVLN